MKIIIAPDSYKESLTAIQVADCIEQGFRQVLPDAHYLKLPLADGGEGTVDAFLYALKGEERYSVVANPLGEPVVAKWGLVDNGHTAVIEMASASGLQLIPPHRRDIARATTFGTGQLLKEAVEAGVRKIILGLGGSATNDGGAGMVQALGGKLLNYQGQELEPGGDALSNIGRIDLSGIDPRLKKIKLILACDVNSPLCGVDGASHVFGPQKGASEVQVAALDEALDSFCRVSSELKPEINPDFPGMGAAGGSPIGLSLLFDYEIRPGIKMLLETVQAKRMFKSADFVITGEGRMDAQTLSGKAPIGVARLARSVHTPVLGIAGSFGQGVEALQDSFLGLYATVSDSVPLSVALMHAEKNLVQTSASVASAIKLGFDTGTPANT
ncbi:glycerate kinase [Endozoicomonas sp. OPT23]|uniref:glycerate kinase n=1 Tax=Endozoicomonas sp. OPT23 TaxID=2072845 RepID=UPI00129A4D96|nr:glycerate kinase [Endozoicomonas sp. OPT23]MRI32905.1 glycerate kinase [Endozoicomonas sp. OPT23]